MQNELQYKLWHHCLAHPGENIMEQAPKSCNGLPKTLQKPNFHAYEACITSKMMAYKKNYSNIDISKISPGSYFQLNYAFIRGPTIDNKRSHLRFYQNGFNIYLLITNIKTRFM